MRLLLRRAVLAATFCSFSAQSTGAANFGPMAMPGAARMAFMAAMPGAAKLTPQPKAAEAKLAEFKPAEIVEVKKAAEPAPYAPPLVEPLPFRYYLQDALGEAVVEFAQRASDAWEEFMRLVGPDPLPLKTVDLDEAYVPTRRPILITDAEIFVAAAPVSPPNPAVAVPAPEPVRARLRQRTFVERAAARLSPSKTTFAQRVPLYHVSNIRKLPSLVPQPWAFPLTRESAGFRALRGPTTPVLPRIEGRWFQAEGGLRFRFIYLNPIGVSGFDARGVSYTMADGVHLSPEEVIPERYWGAYPIFAHGQIVDYVVEVENNGEDDVEGLAVHARQESFDYDGEGGKALQPGARFLFGRLKAGERRAVRGNFKVMSVWEYHGSLEQTHAQVVSVAAGGHARILADEPQAGIIDPPGDQ